MLRLKIPHATRQTLAQPNTLGISLGSTFVIGRTGGSDHEPLITKFRLKLKKVGKTTRPFTCDLNQIPYDYTMEVRNRFKGLDSSVAPDPAESRGGPPPPQDPSPLRGTLGSSLRSPAEGE